MEYSFPAILPGPGPTEGEIATSIERLQFTRARANL
jgi:hypothetical protein